MRTGRSSDTEAAGGAVFGAKVRELLRDLEDTVGPSMRPRSIRIRKRCG